MYKVVKLARYNRYSGETIYRYELHKQVFSWFGLKSSWQAEHGQYTELKTVDELREYVKKEIMESNAENFLEDVKVYATIQDFLSDI